MNAKMRTETEAVSLFCARCSTELRPGGATFFQVHIEAIADPAPPAITAADLEKDHRKEIEDLLKRMSAMSEREAMDQVHRRLTIHLCGPCYRVWIENPAG
jgi:hypothetical protein